MEITTFEPLPPAVKKYFEEKGYEYAVGDTYICKDSEIVRITKIVFDKTRKPFDDYSIKMGYQKLISWDASEWDSVSMCTAHDFKYYFAPFVKLTKSIKEHHQQALDLMEGKIDISIFEDKTSDESLNNESALIHKSSKESLTALQKGMEERKTQAELMKKFVGYEMERRRQEMEVFREKLHGIVASFEKKIKKIMRVITTIELYLGIHEELFQIQEGDKAPSDTPITFRQRVLFVDEEIGHWKDGGLDWTNIEWLDSWLTNPENLQQVFPEKKGLVVFRPRRRKKNYGEDAEYSAKMNAENKFRTYIFIRNGDCLYRVYTENIYILDRLFPQKKELQKLMEVIQKEIKEAEGWSNEDQRKEESKDKVDDMMYMYKNRAVLLQGLIDRTEVFHPLPAEKINIFNLDELGDKVQFIYDDEDALPSGRLSFHDWWKEINSKITQGSRILITGVYPYTSRYDRHDSDPWADRFYLASGKELKNVPDKPMEGVYEVENFTSSYSQHYKETAYKKRLEELAKSGEKFKDEGVVKGSVYTYPDEKTGSKVVYSIRTFGESNLTVMYLPKEEASSGWNRWDTHERKVKTRFKIFPDDDFVLNYDQISLDDINFYLKSRADRPNYLEMMPVLEKIKVHLLQEMKAEKGFIEFVFLRNHDKTLHLPEKEVRERITEAISWWKYKNQWKRPLKKDDTLALRMIEKRILSPNYNKFEKYLI